MSWLAGTEKQNEIARKLYGTDYAHLSCAKKCEVDRQIMKQEGKI